MILYNDNRILINERNQKITDTIFFKDTSIDLFDTVTIFVVLNSSASVNASLSESSDVLFIMQSNNHELTGKLKSLDNIQPIVSGQFVIYQFTVCFNPSNEQSEIDSTLSIRISDTTYSVNLRGYGIEQDANLIEKLQNLNVRFTEDYVKAMRVSDHNESEQDQVILNNKRKEFLYNSLSLAGYAGTYANIDAALSFFGWNGFFTLREIWVDSTGTKYAYTEFGNKILDSVDQRLSGYVKTNRIQLAYQINTLQLDDLQNVVNDANGLEYYINMYQDFAELSVKIYALKRVLERDFMTSNAQITEIVGEYTSVSGTKSTTWLNDAKTMNEYMNDQSPIVFEPEYEDIEDCVGIVMIKNHKLILLRDINEFNEDETKLSRAYSPADEQFIEVISQLTDSDFQDDDVLTKYHEHDLGLFKAKLQFDKTWYNRFRFVIMNADSSELIYDGMMHDIKDMLLYGDYVYIGFNVLGKFVIQLYLYDNWGGIEIVTVESKLRVIDGHINFKLYRQDNLQKNELRAMSSISARRVSEHGRIAYDAFDESYDVNLTEQTAAILTRYSDDELSYKLGHSLLQLSGIPMSQLANRPLSDFGYTYANYFLDPIGKGSAGTRTISLRLFEHNNYDNIIVYYDGVNKWKFLQTIVSTINSNFDSEWSNFTASIDRYSDTGDVNLYKSVLRISSKLPGLTTEKIDLTTYVISSTDVRFYLPLAGTEFLYFGQTAMDDLIIMSGDQTYIVRDYNAVNMDAMKITLAEAFKSMGINAHVHDSVKESTTQCIITTMVPLRIQHVSVGHSYEEPRGVESAYIKRAKIGDEFGIAEPIYAFIDDSWKMHFNDIEWDLRDSLTGRLITTQKAYTFRYMLFKKGSYDLTMRVNNVFGSNSHTKQGAILVR